MEQLPLEISAQAQPTLDTFVPGPNSEALLRVRELAAGSAREPILYLWGEPGSGCSHLLRSGASGAGGIYYAPGESPSTEDAAFIAVDEVERLDERGQVALFVQINRARDGNVRVLCAGKKPPAALALRADLSTRLGWGLVYQLRTLDDEHKKRHLRAEAARRGLQMSEEVLIYLLNRLPRDLGSLGAVLAHLDRHSLARQRALTLPLVRDVLSRLTPPEQNS